MDVKNKTQRLKSQLQEQNPPARVKNLLLVRAGGHRSCRRGFNRQLNFIWIDSQFPQFIGEQIGALLLLLGALIASQ
jgi:hypothetical protein